MVELVRELVHIFHVQHIHFKVRVEVLDFHVGLVCLGEFFIFCCFCFL